MKGKPGFSGNLCEERFAVPRQEHRFAVTCSEDAVTHKVSAHSCDVVHRCLWDINGVNLWLLERDGNPHLQNWIYSEVLTVPLMWALHTGHSNRAVVQLTQVTRWEHGNSSIPTGLSRHTWKWRIVVKGGRSLANNHPMLPPHQYLAKIRTAAN